MFVTDESGAPWSAPKPPLPGFMATIDTAIRRNFCHPESHGSNSSAVRAGAEAFR